MCNVYTKFRIKIINILGEQRIVFLLFFAFVFLILLMNSSKLYHFHNFFYFENKIETLHIYFRHPIDTRSLSFRWILVGRMGHDSHVYGGSLVRFHWTVTKGMRKKNFLGDTSGGGGRLTSSPVRNSNRIQYIYIHT